jgi:hypothetical protein
MTAKEKAKELVHLYYEVDGDSIYDGITRGMAKQCALICVDEIIGGSRLFYIEDYEYWREVKQELLKL